MGYKKLGERWVKPEELAAERQDADRQRKADKQWKSRLDRIRDGLDSRDKAKRARAEESLAEVKDPRAVPMIWTALLRGGEKSQLAAVTTLAEIDTRAAATALAALAIYSQSPQVRNRATKKLAERDLRDFAGKLIGLVQKPFEYEVKPTNGPDSPAKLVLKQDKTETTYTYQLPGVDPSSLPRYFGSSVAFDPFSPQNLMMASMAAGAYNYGYPGGNIGAMSGFGAGRGMANNPGTNLIVGTYAMAALRDLQVGMAVARDMQLTNLYLQRKLEQDIQIVEMTNKTIKQLNERVLPVLKEVTGEDFGVEPEKWKKWWAIELGYLSESDSDSKTEKTSGAAGREPVNQTCFAAGTLVHTASGRQPIERVEIGDLVLSQNTTTGVLSFQPVTAIRQRKSIPLLRVSIDGETLTATASQRFWKPGEGWTMARQLRPECRLRAHAAIAKFLQTTTADPQSAFSFEVAENHDFFVGAKALLVHDAGLVEPALAPFDQVPDLTTLAPRGTTR